jgi:dTDP-4-dehydrorhamnose reductase
MQRPERGPLLLSPTYAPDLIHTALDLLIDAERGIWHLANEGADRAPGALTSPRNRTLGSEKGTLMPPLEDALARCASDQASCAGVGEGQAV